MSDTKELILVTGGNGFVGRALVSALTQRYHVVSFERTPSSKPGPHLTVEACDVTSDDSVRSALQRVRERFGERVVSVIHLAAYFDLTGEPNQKYEEITVRGTQRLLRQVQSFAVDQFVFVSTMLVHAAGKPGELVNAVNVKQVVA